MQTVWWAVARSEEVTGKKPLAVDVGDQAVVLWRDQGGGVRALEDRCPHRRAPLSLGCVRKEGWLQCGYHGWSFDGETGRVREIPNLKDEQRFPAIYRAQAHAVHEADGWVRVRIGAGTDAPEPSGVEMPLAGTTQVSLDHARYLAAFFDDPGVVMAVRGVSFTTYVLSDLHAQNGHLVVERCCQWRGPHWPAAFSSEYPITLLSRTAPVTGETELVLRDHKLQTLLAIRLAPVPASRGVTTIRWRAALGANRSGVFAKSLGFGNPVTIFDKVDGAALRALKPSVSLQFDALWRRLTAAESTVAA